MAAYQANGMNALVYFFIHENVERFAGSAYDAGRPFWHVIASLFLGFAPWSVFLPMAGIQFLQREHETVDPEVKNSSLFLWLWIVISVGFFCFSHGKCDYYTLPAYPAAALLCGHWVSERMQNAGLFIRMIMAIFACAFLFAGIASCALLPSMGL